MPKYPIVVSPGAIQATIYALLRVLVVLVGGATTIASLLSARDLAGLVAYVQSSDFLAVSGALSAAISLVYGMWRTYRIKRDSVTMADHLPDAIATVRTKPLDSAPLAAIPVLFVLVAAGLLAGCSTIGGDVRLNAYKAFLTAQIAFKSAQQTTIAFCSAPAAVQVEPCNKAIDLLREGAKAEAAGFTAQQAGNAAGMSEALTVLVALPAQLAALGILEAN